MVTGVVMKSSSGSGVCLLQTVRIRTFRLLLLRTPPTAENVVKDWFVSLARRFSPSAPNQEAGSRWSYFAIKAVRMPTGADLKFSSASGICIVQRPFYDCSLRSREGSHPSQ